jgi:hypothetical protein
MLLNIVSSFIIVRKAIECNFQAKQEQLLVVNIEGVEE